MPGCFAGAQLWGLFLPHLCVFLFFSFLFFSFFSFFFVQEEGEKFTTERKTLRWSGSSHTKKKKKPSLWIVCIYWCAFHSVKYFWIIFSLQKHMVSYPFISLPLFLFSLPLQRVKKKAPLKARMWESNDDLKNKQKQIIACFFLIYFLLLISQHNANVLTWNNQ